MSYLDSHIPSKMFCGLISSEIQSIITTTSELINVNATMLLIIFY